MELMSCFNNIICEQKLNQSVDTSDYERSEGADGVLAGRWEHPFTIYFWTIRIMCYVKVWKYIIVICSLVFRRRFLIRCAILVIKCKHVNWLNVMINKNKRIVMLRMAKNIRKLTEKSYKRCLHFVIFQKKNICYLSRKRYAVFQNKHWNPRCLRISNKPVFSHIAANKKFGSVLVAINRVYLHRPCVRTSNPFVFRCVDTFYRTRKLISVWYCSLFLIGLDWAIYRRINAFEVAAVYKNTSIANWIKVLSVERMRIFINTITWILIFSVEKYVFY